MSSRVEKIIRNPLIYSVVGVFCLLMVGYSILYTEPSFGQRTIGLAALLGLDSSLRGFVHVFSVVASVCIFLALYLRIGTDTFIPEYKEESAKESHLLILLLLANLLLYFNYDNPIFLNAGGALLFLLGLGFVIKLFGMDEVRNDFLWILMALIFQGLMVVQSLVAVPLSFGLEYFGVFGVVLVLLAWITLPKEGLQDAHIRILKLSHGLFPLMLAPLSIIAANEIQYSLGRSIDYSGSAFPIWMMLLAAIFLFTVIQFFRHPRSGVNGKPVDIRGRMDRLLMSRYLPLVLASSVAFSEYRDLISFFTTRDFYHGGEAVVPIQQMMQFGSIPYIHFIPTHGFFDILPQFFYQLVHQGEYIESILWGEGYGLGWLPRMLSIVAIYWLIKDFIGHKSAFLVLLFLPFYHMLHPYYVVLLLPLFAPGLEKSGFRQWLAFWSLLALVFLWRVDFGISAMAASLFVLVGWFWYERSATNIRRCIVAAVTVVGVASLVFGYLSFSNGKNPIHLLEQYLAYVQLQVPLGMLEHIIKQLDFAALLQYILLPLIGVIIAARFLAIVIRGERPSRQMQMLAFLAVTSLVISSRSLNRHTLYVGVFNPYFFSLLYALAPIVMFRFSKTANVAILVVVCVGSYTFFPRTTSPMHALYHGKTLQQEYPYPAAPGNVSLASASAPHTRLDGVGSGAEDISQFLLEYLRDDETFYDFSNTPLLYALSKRKMPVLIMETVYHGSEKVQQQIINDLDLLFQQGKLPIVLFSQFPASSPWNIPDGINKETRSYRVAEYIYQNYVPCARVGNHEVWLARSRENGGDCISTLRTALDGSSAMVVADTSIVGQRAQQFELQKLPYVWANYDQAMASVDCASGQTLATRPLKDFDGRGFKIILTSDVIIGSANYIYLQIDSGSDTRAELKYAGENNFTFDVLAGSKSHEYLIRVSSQYAWSHGQFNAMSLISEDPIDLICAAIIPGD